MTECMQVKHSSFIFKSNMLTYTDPYQLNNNNNGDRVPSLIWIWVLVISLEMPLKQGSVPSSSQHVCQ